MVDHVRALFGIETEYAVSIVGADSGSREGAVRRIYERAASRPHLPGIESGIFLTSGARFYVDGGHHPEYASPETANPWDGVRYALAGDRLVSRLAGEVAANTPELRGVVVRKGNIDYTSRTTWASHENYLHRCAPVQLRPALVSHLVSRIVFTGGGGFDPFVSPSPPFVLSPRALFVQRLIGASAPGALALVDDRNQPLCRGFYRQHVMCADATQSHLTMLLRLGTTALVVGLIDAGCVDDQHVVLANPLEALATVARDVTLRQPLALWSGGTASALDIQRHYLRQSQDHLDVLPDWAGRMCEVWEDTLRRLEQGPAAVADRLDWAIKHAVLERHRTRCAGRCADEGQAELYEIDLRFGQVYPPSLFEALDAAGVLHHRVARAGDIEAAISNPPEDGRARIRGAVVARMAGEPGVQCGWDCVHDIRSARALDLTSPFADAEEWRVFPPSPASGCAYVARLAHLAGRPSSPDVTRMMRETAQWIIAAGKEPSPRTGEHAIQLNNYAIAMRLAGRLEDAEWLMRAALGIDLAVPNRHKVPHRRNNLGTVLLMQGRLSEAREEVALAWQQIGSRYDRTSARVLAVRLAIALVSGEPVDLLVGQLKCHAALQPLGDFADVERRWRVNTMVAALAPRLTAAEHHLLKAVGGLLNGDRTLASMDEYPAWRDAPAQTLDVPWPCESARV